MNAQDKENCGEERVEDQDAQHGVPKREAEGSQHRSDCDVHRQDAGQSPEVVPHELNRASPSPQGAELSHLRTRVTYLVGGMWTLSLLATFVLLVIVGISAKHPQADEVKRDIAATVNIGLGTLVGFAQVPNRRLGFAFDGDLAAFSLMFLALGGVLPLAHSLGAYKTLAWALLLGFLAALLAIALLNRRARKRPPDSQSVKSLP
jgi:hypothetical protein